MIEAPVASANDNITVIAEGRIAQFAIKATEAARVVWLNSDDPDSPIVLTFSGDNGFFIRVFDHRAKSREIFRKGLMVYLVLFDWQGNLPCLGGFRLKRHKRESDGKECEIQYIVLADLGAPDIGDGGENEALVLARAGEFDKSQYKVCANGMAIHRATKLCLLEPRVIDALLSGRTQIEEENRP